MLRFLAAGDVETLNSIGVFALLLEQGYYGSGRLYMTSMLYALCGAGPDAGVVNDVVGTRSRKVFKLEKQDSDDLRALFNSINDRVKTIAI